MKVHQNFNEWFSARGDETLMLDHNINENSHVVEIGGFKGEWVSQIINKFNPYVYIFEPIEEYYTYLLNKYANNPKIKIYKVGISNKKETANISLIGDGSSVVVSSSNTESVCLIPFDEMLYTLNLSTIDLMQINIEGAEYDVLEYAINKNLLKNIKKILIQFHTNIANCESRRKSIQHNLENFKFTKIFDFPFIWEGWIKHE